MGEDLMLNVDRFLFQGTVFCGLVAASVWAGISLVTDEANFCKTPDMCERKSAWESSLRTKPEVRPARGTRAESPSRDIAYADRDRSPVRHHMIREVAASDCSSDETSEADACARRVRPPDASLEHITDQ
ncbi:MAG: hypothetical protein RLN72_12155 [Henriciella sp.]